MKHPIKMPMTPLTYAKPICGLSPQLRASLDIARATAAIYVALHHAANHFGWPFGLRLTFAFGQEAVLIFFLLSGFVIFANEHNRIHDTRAYFWRRIKRIYPCLIISMALSILVALDNGKLAEVFRWDEFWGTLANLQDQDNKPGIIVSPFMENGPLWSLSYEMVFYLLFPPAMLAWKKYGPKFHHIVGVFSCLSYAMYLLLPNHWSLVAAYFIAWWCGAIAAHCYLQGYRNFKPLLPLLLWLGALVTLAGIAIAILGYRGLAYFPFLQFRHLLVTLGIIVFFFGPIGVWLSKFATPISVHAAYLASISYGIYVFHVPLMMRWDRVTSAWSIVLSALAVITLSIVFDRGLTNWMRNRAAARKAALIN